MSSARTIRGLPLLGSLLPISKDALAFFTRTLSEQGDRVFLRVLDRRILLLCHPDDIGEVLVRNREAFGRSAEVLKLRPIFGRGLLASEGDLWREQRGALQPSFGYEALRKYHGIMLAAMSRRLRECDLSLPLDTQAEMMRYTRDVIWEVLFSDSLPDEDPLSDAVAIVFGDLRSEVLYLPLWRRLPLPRSRRWNRAVHRLNAAIRTKIESRRNSGERKDDLLDALLYASSAGESAMPDQQVHDEILTFFLAGHETAALGLTWSAYLLACHPDIQEQVAREIGRMASERELAADDLTSLPLTTAVIKEALRLYPPVWTIGRRACRDTHVGDLPVSRGTDLWICLHRTHRDPRWFSEPNTFRPERWLNSPPIKPLSFLPFGAGPRVCIGQHFAMAEAVLGLANMVKLLQFHAPERPVRPQAWITLRPDNMRLPVSKRRASTPGNSEPNQVSSIQNANTAKTRMI